MGMVCAVWCLAAADGARPGQPKPPAEAKQPIDGAAALARPFGKKAPEGKLKLQEILANIEDQTGFVIRVDQAALRDLLPGVEDADDNMGQKIAAMLETTVVLSRQIDRVPMRDVLADALSAVESRPWTYHVRGAQILLRPAYLPGAQPGMSEIYPSVIPDEERPEPFLPSGVRYPQISGPTVRISIQQSSLAEVLAALRKQTGANILLDPRCETQLKEKRPLLDVDIADVRLFDALRAIADMAGLKMIYAGNVYYITTVENAGKFEPGSAYQPPPKAPIAAKP